MNKTCNRCQQTLALTDFYKCKGMRDGHMGQCKACILGAQHTYYRKNRERILRQQQGYVSSYEVKELRKIKRLALEERREAHQRG